MRRHVSSLVLCVGLGLSTASCLRVPTPTPAADAGRELDAGAPPPPPFVVERVEVRSLDDAAWPASGIPRRPIVHVVFSARPRLDAEPALFLLRGDPDDDLVDDLADDPLRAATRARVIPSTIHVEGHACVVEPDERLAAGDRLTLAIGGWARAADDPDRVLDGPSLVALTVAAGGEAGAAPTDSWPPAGASTVPTTLPSVAVRFDGPVRNVREGLRLLEREAALAGVAREVECAPLGWSDGFCASFTPDRALAPGVEHRVEIGPEVLDETGAPAGPWEARFVTARDSDEQPPLLLAPSCALDERAIDPGVCVLASDRALRLLVQADEPARVALAVAGQERVALAPRGRAVIELDALPPATDFPSTLTLTDLGGQEARHALTLSTTAPLLTITLSEVRADPAGAEPRQELVEVLNFGAVPVDLAGVSLSDRPDSVGDVIASAFVLAPGQRAVLVADDFDPDDPSDAPVPPGVLLVHVGRSLAGGGITNAGEALYLRDAALRRLSATPPIGAPEGSCLVRLEPTDRPRTDTADAFAIGPCTPGLAP